MASDKLLRVADSRLSLLFLEEGGYVQKLIDLVKSVGNDKGKICFVCIRMPYDDISKVFKKMGVDMNSIVFVDTLSSHYQKPLHARNCIFVPSPSDLESIKYAIHKAVKENNCNVIIFDAISTLLEYNQSFYIIKFTNNLILESAQPKTKTLYIISKQDDSTFDEIDNLTKDLEMFADKKWTHIKPEATLSHKCPLI